jgi:hypothetical protein
MSVEYEIRSLDLMSPLILAAYITMDGCDLIKMNWDTRSNPGRLSRHERWRTAPPIGNAGQETHGSAPWELIRVGRFRHPDARNSTWSGLKWIGDEASPHPKILATLDEG